MRSSFEYFLYSNAVLVVAVIAGVSIALYCSCSFLWRKNFASRKKSKNRYRKPGKSAKQAKYRQLKNKFSSEEESVIEGEKSIPGKRNYQKFLDEILNQLYATKLNQSLEDSADQPRMRGKSKKSKKGKEKKMERKCSKIKGQDSKIQNNEVNCDKLKTKTGFFNCVSASKDYTMCETYEKKAEGSSEKREAVRPNTDQLVAAGNSTNALCDSVNKDSYKGMLTEGHGTRQNRSVDTASDFKDNLQYYSPKTKLLIRETQIDCGAVGDNEAYKRSNIPLYATRNGNNDRRSVSSSESEIKVKRWTAKTDTEGEYNVSQISMEEAKIADDVGLHMVKNELHGRREKQNQPVRNKHEQGLPSYENFLHSSKDPINIKDNHVNHVSLKTGIYACSDLETEMGTLEVPGNILPRTDPGSFSNNGSFKAEMKKERLHGKGMSSNGKSNDALVNETGQRVNENLTMGNIQRENEIHSDLLAESFSDKLLDIPVSGNKPAVVRARTDDFKEKKEYATLFGSPPSSAGYLSPTKKIESVTAPILIDEYAAREWKGDTAMAETIKKGYNKVKDETGLICIRRIRGDNYCALRAVIFKILSSGIDILSEFKDNHKLCQLPDLLMDDNCMWLKNWSFANRLNVSRGSVAKKLKDCLDFLTKIVNQSTSCYQDTERYKMTLDLMNAQEENEIMIFEAVKFLMLYKSINLYKKMQSGENVEILPALLFARDTSPSPEFFMKNHLNRVGNSCGLDQLEMMLLGHTLNTVIKVFRLHRVNDDDFIMNFPVDIEDPEGCVTLVVEDDRHYNVLSEES